MAVQHIHSYLVHPGRGAQNAPQIRGTKVPLEGKLFRLLDSIYADSDVECDIDIAFNHTAGVQQNDCRDLVVSYLRGPTLARGRHIAQRLQRVTDYRSGLGLLFLIAGKEGHDNKVIISRFPTDTAILAEEGARELTVQFLERVFMKSASSYKAAAYQDSSFQAGFWLGKAVDRQIGGRIVELSDYWIFDFLASNFQVTPAAGTRRLGAALRNATRKADLSVKREIVAAVTLARAFKGRNTSISEFEAHFGLSEEAREAINGEVKSPTLVEQRFRFDPEEFDEQVGYRYLELDNGAMMTAQSAEFDNVFHQEVVDEEEHKIRVSTTGKVVTEKLGKSK